MTIDDWRMTIALTPLLDWARTGAKSTILQIVNRHSSESPPQARMLILGIESSCDETAAAVVAETGDAAKPWVIRSSVVASQVEIHREWGGVVPELASRQHVRDICGVVERALG